MKSLKKVRVILSVFLTVILPTLPQAEAYAQTGSVIVKSEEEDFILEGMPEIVAQAAIAVDMTTGYTIYEKNIYEKYYPASITKIMTAVLAIENLDLTSTVTFSHNAVFTIEPGSSSGYLNEGEQITAEQCLYGLMLISGNDLANGLAEAVSGSMDDFAVKMTEKAAELGCVSTSFKNAHGLHDEEHYTCAYDMALMSKYAYDKLEMFRTLISTIVYEVPPTAMCDEARRWLNTNRMIREGEEYYDDDCLGGKTGFTDQAGGTFVSFHKINDRVIMIVILKDTNSAGAYVDTKLICDYISENTNEQYFADMDEAFRRRSEKESESMSEVQSVNANVSGNDRNNTNDRNDKTADVSEPENAKEHTVPPVVKLLLVLLIIFLLYYCYINMQRNRRRKHSRKYYREKNSMQNAPRREHR